MKNKKVSKRVIMLVFAVAILLAAVSLARLSFKVCYALDSSDSRNTEFVTITGAGIQDDLNLIANRSRLEENLSEEYGCVPVIAIKEYGDSFKTAAQRQQWILENCYNSASSFTVVYFTGDSVKNSDGFLYYADGTGSINYVDSWIAKSFAKELRKSWEKGDSIDKAVSELFGRIWFLEKVMSGNSDSFKRPAFAAFIVFCAVCCASFFIYFYKKDLTASREAHRRTGYVIKNS